MHAPMMINAPAASVEATVAHWTNPLMLSSSSTTAKSRSRPSTIHSNPGDFVKRKYRARMAAPARAMGPAAASAAR